MSSDHYTNEVNEVDKVEKIADQKIKDLEIKSCTITEMIQNGIEYILRRIIFWESDDKKLGMLIQLIHHGFVYGMVLWYIYLHTFSNSYIQFILFYFIFSLVWIQHIFCGVCLIFNIEQKLVGNHPNIIDNILHIFHITPTEDVGNGVLLIMSSLTMAMLTGELLSRTIVGIKQLF